MSGIIEKDVLRFQVPKVTMHELRCDRPHIHHLPVYNVEIVEVFQSQ